mmetsp:Transcript_53261/g.157538  ORF Transcript_53261/g.157538 Transcript_53261/m.157538 type:complete len:290 (-) Transcript_53261:1033-1902(-)
MYMRRSSRQKTLNSAGSESASVRSMWTIDLKDRMSRTMRTARARRRRRITIGLKGRSPSEKVKTVSTTERATSTKSNWFHMDAKYWREPRPSSLRAHSIMKTAEKPTPSTRSARPCQAALRYSATSVASTRTLATIATKMATSKALVCTNRKQPRRSLPMRVVAAGGRAILIAERAVTSRNTSTHIFCLTERKTVCSDFSFMIWNCSMTTPMTKFMMMNAEKKIQDTQNRRVMALGPSAFLSGGVTSRPSGVTAASAALPVQKRTSGQRSSVAISKSSSTEAPMLSKWP